MLRLNTKVRTFVPTWNDNHKLPAGDRIEVDHLPLTIGDLLAVQIESGINILAGQTLDTTSPENTSKSWDLMRAILVKYVTAWRGIEIDDTPVTDTEQLLKALPADLLILAAEVFGHLLSSSSGSAEQAKNLPSRSVAESAGTTTVASPVVGPDSSANEAVSLPTP